MEVDQQGVVSEGEMEGVEEMEGEVFLVAGEEVEEEVTKGLQKKYVVSIISNFIASY